MTYRRDLSSEIQIGEEKTRVTGYYHLDKTIVCDSDEIARGVIEKLDRLQKEDFNRVRIPKFDYYAMDNAVRYRVEFIKGWPLGTVSRNASHIIYQDVVNRESDWTFDDYSMGNFVVEPSGQVWAVDFTSYRYMPDREERNEKWKIKEEMSEFHLDQLGLKRSYKY